MLYPILDPPYEMLKLIKNADSSRDKRENKPYEHARRFLDIIWCSTSSIAKSLVLANLIDQQKF